MEEEEGLHQLDEYLSDYVYLESLVVLVLDEVVHIHTQYLCDQTLE